jgi:hypothetical protein
MKLHLTAYRVMAPLRATRVKTENYLNIHQLLSRAAPDLADAEFDELVAQLTDFWERSRAEYPAIYFWVGE